MKEEMLEKVLNAHKNLIVEGDVASGKSTNILFPIVENAIERKESLFILDSKEEYINRYYDKLKLNNYNTVIINLRDMDKSEGWNPLEYPYILFKNGYKDKAQEYLEKIGKVIFYEDSNQDPFWSASSSDFFTGVTLGLFEDGNANEVNLNSVNNMFNGSDKRFAGADFITEYFKTKDVTSAPYIFASSTISAPNETKGSILSLAKQKLRLYVSREELSHLMSKSTFSFKDIVNRPTAIIFIARDENNSLNGLSAMFIEQLYGILVDLKNKNKFNLFLDNFDTIEKCNDLVDILSSCVSRNIKTYIATRSLSELTKTYGSYMRVLCDLVSIRNNDIQLIINNVEQRMNKEFETVTIQSGNVSYPRLSINETKVFDMEKFVKDKKMEKFSNLYSEIVNKNNDNNDNNENYVEPLKTDDIIRKIDEKLAQIEMAQKMRNNKENNEVE